MPAYIDTDHEPRPNMVLHLNRRIQKPRTTLKAWANAVLAKLKENIRTNKNGTWAKVKYGLKAGGLALQGTEDDWFVDSPAGSDFATIRVRQGLEAKWRGHIHDGPLVIRPHPPKKCLHFFLDDGSEWFLKKVTLPKRDPRPTINQIRQIRI